LALAALIAAIPASAAVSTGRSLTVLEDKVRHELVMLPYYNVFDNLSFRVDGDSVILSGQVRRPVLKSDAENVVKRIPGVARVINNVEVLPLSNFDDRVRFAVYRAIYSQPGLDRYALGAVPGIHIIVKNGSVTLEGVVGNEMDRNLAFLRANQVFGVFSVVNRLRVEGQQQEQ
jgi:hyperosmotically inducible protein